MPTKQELEQENDDLKAELSKLRYEVIGAIQHRDSRIVELEQLALHYEKTINVLSGRVMALNSVTTIGETTERNA